MILYLFEALEQEKESAVYTEYKRRKFAGSPFDIN